MLSFQRRNKTFLIVAIAIGMTTIACGITSPTTMPIAPTATPIPVPTPIPDTPSDSVLEEGEWWYSGGKAILLSKVELFPGWLAIATEWKVANLSPNTVTVSWSQDSFEARDNLGRRAQIEMWHASASPITIPSGEVVELAPTIVFKIDFTNASVTEVIITASISNIQNARWRVPIYH